MHRGNLSTHSAQMIHSDEQRHAAYDHAPVTVIVMTFTELVVQVRIQHAHVYFIVKKK